MSLLLSSAKVNIFNLPMLVSDSGLTNPLTITLSFGLSGGYGGTELGRWYLPVVSNIGNDFEILAEEVGGPAGFTGTFGTWLVISESRTWSLTQSSAGFKAGQINFSLRRSGETAVIITNLCDWFAEVTV